MSHSSLNISDLFMTRNSNVYCSFCIMHFSLFIGEIITVSLKPSPMQSLCDMFPISS